MQKDHNYHSCIIFCSPFPIIPRFWFIFFSFWTATELLLSSCAGVQKANLKPAVTPVNLGLCQTHTQYHFLSQYLSTWNFTCYLLPGCLQQHEALQLLAVTLPLSIGWCCQQTLLSPSCFLFQITSGETANASSQILKELHVISFNFETCLLIPTILF